MLDARDIFTVKFMGREPSLKDLLLGLPPSVSAALLAGVKATTAKDIDAAIQKLSATQRKNIQRHANLILNGSRVEKEELEELAKSNSILVGRGDSSYNIVHRLIETLGFENAERALTALLSVTSIERSGTFSEFDAPSLDPTNVNFLEWMNQLEAYFELQLSKGAKETRS